MKKPLLLLLMKPVLAGIMFIIFLQQIQAQKPAEFSLTGSAGVTLVNFKEALGIADRYMIDWSQFHYGGELKFFLPSKGTIQLGLNGGWNQLYYAYYEYTFDDVNYFTEEYDVYTFSTMALCRFSQKSAFFTMSAGIHIFKSGVAGAFGLEAGWNIKLSDNLYLPISCRSTAIFDDGLPIPVCGMAGLAYRFK